MKTLRFTSTKLKQINKNGILNPDQSGYREMVLGGLNAFNSAGEYYTLKGAEELFQESSILMRRIGKGMVKAELGHPKLNSNMTEMECLERICTIEEKNVCAHIRSLWLDHEFGRKHPEFNNPNLVAIMGEICPSGPYGPALEKSLNNTSENVAFSIRGLTDNYYERGQCYRVLKTIVGFDQVSEQGINIANKWDSPALESLYEYTLSETNLKKINTANINFATESTKEIMKDIITKLNNDKVTNKPVFTRW